jgi:anti-sigma regulatory factor (Ser/Thr protein kinase)/DNA-binding transcriptional ArsR family regulator
MTAQPRGEAIRNFIFANLAKHPADIAKRVSTRFRITRQAAHKHLRRLVDEGLVTQSGQTRNHAYALAVLAQWQQSYPIEAGLAEDIVWTRDIRPLLGPLPANVLTLWQHGFTEMFNNAIDHSGGAHIHVEVRSTAADAEMIIADDGIGIFRKIQDQLGLLDERHAILELSKGKLTTDPARHSGEGIFFTSRMFDTFNILSGGVSFSHSDSDANDWIRDNPQYQNGTTVWLRLNSRTTRTTKQIFDEYVSGDDYDFSRTVVPVVLAQHLGEPLLSRSQAKRVLARVDLFRTVVFDFSHIDSIGQAFADEIFRVFAQSHPQMDVQFVHANASVARMIARARSHTNG